MPEDYKQMKIKIASSKTQRARKSFPTPKILSSTSTLQILSVPSSTTITEKQMPPSTDPPALNMFQKTNQKTINNMVYIPIDNNLNRPLDPNEFLRVSSSSMPIPPLVTVSNNTIPYTNPSNNNPQSTQLSTTVKLVSSTQNNSTAQTSTVSSTTTSFSTTSCVSSTPSNQNNLMSGFVTSNLASALTNSLTRGPPKLIPKPMGPLRSDSEANFSPDVGPLSRKLNDNAHKVCFFFE